MKFLLLCTKYSHAGSRDATYQLEKIFSELCCRQLQTCRELSPNSASLWSFESLFFLSSSFRFSSPQIHHVALSSSSCKPQAAVRSKLVTGGGKSSIFTPANQTLFRTCWRPSPRFCPDYLDVGGHTERLSPNNNKTNNSGKWCITVDEIDSNIENVKESQRKNPESGSAPTLPLSFVRVCAEPQIPPDSEEPNKATDAAVWQK